MSLSDDNKALKEIYKPFLKYEIGDQVFLKTDKKGAYPMIIIDFEIDDYTSDDYHVTWFNCQGKLETSSFPEECLVTEIINE